MKATLCALLAMILMSASSFAATKDSLNWYFSSKSQNERPGLPAVDPAIAKGIGKDEKVLYLTFDAGYENGNVKKTVDILKENGVTGAFFVLSHFIQANPELCREMKKNGNLVCNHTATHPSIVRLSQSELKAELETVEKLFEETTGQKLDPYFRPPRGEYSEAALKRVSDCGYRTVFWSLAWADWDNNDQKTPEYAMNKLLPRVHNGAVILLHPTSKTNAEILSDFIVTMKNKGYRFGSIEELWES